MAKHSTALARPIIVQMPRRSGGGRFRRAGRRAVGFARKVRHSRHAPSLSLMALMLGGAGLGWAEQKGHLQRLPKIGGSAAGSLAAAGYVAVKYGKHKAIKALGYAAVVAGAFDFGRVQAGGTSGLEGLDEETQFGERNV